MNTSTSICLFAFILTEWAGQDYKKNWSNENKSVFSQSFPASILGKLVSGKCLSVWWLGVNKDHPSQCSFSLKTLHWDLRNAVSFKEGRHREDWVSCWQTFGWIFERMLLPICKRGFFFFTEVLILRTLFGNWLWDHVCNFLSEQKGLYMFDSQVMKAMYLKGTAVFRLLIVHNLSASKKMGSGVAHEKICARDPHAYHSIKPVAFGKRRR